jgi:hypothetical protein
MPEDYEKNVKRFHFPQFRSYKGSKVTHLDSFILIIGKNVDDLVFIG